MNLPHYYEDPSVLHVNCEPNRAYYLPDNSVCQLSGTWDFLFFQSMQDIPDDVYAQEDIWRKAATIPVPSVWQNFGYDHHQYTNINYPFPFDPPYVPLHNPAGLYRRRLSLDKAVEKRYYLNFEGVDSCFFVWMNGKFVGYSQVSHSTSEFDVTDVLQTGDNILMVLVLKWCDGSYLEDQDKLRMSGIFRDVYILERPREHLRDYFVHTQLSEDFCSAVLRVDLSFYDEQLPVKGTLYDPNGEKMAVVTNQVRSKLELEVDKPFLWNAESPMLYTLVMECGGERIEQHVGFRKIEIRNRVVYLNGVPFKIRGVNRHDMDPVTGYAISREQALVDLKIMKEHNINSIRTSHYPNAPWFPQLCDEYGFYVIAESDIECHGTVSVYELPELAQAYDDKYSALAIDERFSQAILDRVERNVERDKNCPCVLIWSLGSEAGYGCNFERAGRWVKQRDDSRLTHYENMSRLPTWPCNTDMIDLHSQMYPSIEEVVAYCKNPKNSKPFLLVEHIHSMGNGPGDAEDYKQMIDRLPQVCGGLAWEFCDQAVYLGRRADGKRQYAYGGDFGDFPNDGNFCVDGLVYPDRTPHTGLREYKNVLRPVRASMCEGEVCSQSEGEVEIPIEIHNKLDFINLEKYATAVYTITADGEKCASGTLPILSVAPREKKRFILKTTLPRASKIILTLNYLQRNDMPLTAKGHLLGFDQFVLRDNPCVPENFARNVDDTVKGKKAPLLIQDGKKISVEGENFRYTFSRLTGNFESMNFHNHCLLEKPMEYNIWRAPVDNDMYISPLWKAAGYDRAYSRVYTSETYVQGACAIIEASLAIEATSLQKIMEIRARYEIGFDGQIFAKLSCKRDMRMPYLPRFGVRFFLPSEMEQVEYFGYGPDESYIDKHHGSKIGKYRVRVKENHEDYIKPQENGSHYGCDYIVLSSHDKGGLLAFGETSVSFNVSHYSQEELTTCRHNYELTESGHTIFCLDYAMSGVGSNSCGPELMEKYRLNEPEFVFQFHLAPIIPFIK